MRRRGLSGLIGLSLITALISSLFPTTAAAADYKIKQGDSLSRIAARHHTTVAKLMKANHLRPTSILALGKSLRVPGEKVARQPRASRACKQAMAHKAPPVGYAVHVCAGSACLRAGASSGSRRMALLSTGSTVKVLSKQGKWAKVAMSNGVCGYVYRPLMATGAASAKSASSAEPAKPAKAKEADAAPDRSVIQLAMTCRGAHYVRGGTSRGGFDCSGFTRYVYAKYGINLPHSSAAQAGRGTAVSRGELKAGDLVFFQTNRRGISHVGIYIGSGSFIHAASRGSGVRVDSLDSSYYAPRYRGARRVG